jgi:hypothetical protein
MQIATSDCTDEWKSKRRDQPKLFSLLSSETADKLDKVLAILERIEGRQIKVKEEIDDG